MPSSLPQASATAVNCHFEGIDQERGAIASIAQGGVFTLTSSTIISRTTFDPNWGSERRRSLFFFDDGFEVSSPPVLPNCFPSLPNCFPSHRRLSFLEQGVLQLLYSLEQVKELPMAVLEITDTQVCTLHATHGTSGLHSHLHRPARRRSRARAAPTHQLAQVTQLVSTQ